MKKLEDLNLFSDILEAIPEVEIVAQKTFNLVIRSYEHVIKLLKGEETLELQDNEEITDCGDGVILYTLIFPDAYFSAVTFSVEYDETGECSVVGISGVDSYAEIPLTKENYKKFADLALRLFGSKGSSAEANKELWEIYCRSPKGDY